MLHSFTKGCWEETIAFAWHAPSWLHVWLCFCRSLLSCLSRPNHLVALARPVVGIVRSAAVARLTRNCLPAQ